MIIHNQNWTKIMAVASTPKIQSIKNITEKIVPIESLSHVKITVLSTIITTILILGFTCIIMLFINNGIQQVENNFNMKLMETRSSINNSVSENIIFLKIFILNNKVDVKLAQQISRSVYKWARVYDRDPDLMLSLIKIESNFNQDAVSSANAEGLTQIMPFWYEIFKEPQGTFKQVDESIEYGHRILALYEKQYSDIGMALTAYNRGQYQIETALIKGTDPANGYASKILEVYNKLKSMNVGI